MGREVDGVGNHIFDFAATTGLVEDCAGSGVDDLDAGFGMRAGSDAVGGPRMGDLEGGGGKGSLRFIADPDFISAHPKVAIVSRVSATTGRDGVAFDWAFGPNGSGLGPTTEVAFFEADVGSVGGDDAWYRLCSGSGFFLIKGC